MRDQYVGLSQGGVAGLLRSVGRLQRLGRRAVGVALGARQGKGGKGSVELPCDVRRARDTPGNGYCPAAGGLGTVPGIESGGVRGTASRGSKPGEPEEISPVAS